MLKTCNQFHLREFVLIGIFLLHIPLCVSSDDIQIELKNIENLCKRGKFSDAYLQFNKLTFDENTKSKFYYWKARCLMALHRYDEALDDFLIATNSDTKNVDILLWFSRCVSCTRHFQSSIGFLDVALKMEQNNHLLFSQRAFALAENARYREAHEDIKKAEDIGGKRCRTLYCKICILIGEGKYDEAETQLKECFSLHSDDVKDCWEDWGCNCIPHLHSSCALIHANRKNFTLAIASLTKAINIEPCNGEWYFSRARMYAEKGEYSNALKDIEKAENLVPTWKDMLKNFKNKIQNKKDTGIFHLDNEFFEKYQ
jgi:tetratricopeptide (TPR) repeat protein